MGNKNHWEEFFDGHAPRYMQNVFTKNTFAEVNFLIDELKLPEASEILDMAAEPADTAWSWLNEALR